MVREVAGRYKTIVVTTGSSGRRTWVIGNSTVTAIRRKTNLWSCFSSLSASRGSDAVAKVGGTDFPWFYFVVEGTGHLRPWHETSFVIRIFTRSNKTTAPCGPVRPRKQTSLQRARWLCTNGTWVQSTAARTRRKWWRSDRPSSAEQGRRTILRKLARTVGGNNHNVHESHASLIQYTATSTA